MTDVADGPLGGAVVSLHVAAAHGDRPVSVAEVYTVPGQGVVGDRYFAVPDPTTDGRRAGAEITLIALEALEALARDCGITLTAGESRRNVACRGIDLSCLVGTEFWVGAVRLRGTKLSQPCVRLERLTQPGVVKGLVHRAGLRAEIVEGGTIRVGDLIRATNDDGARRVPCRPRW